MRTADNGATNIGACGLARHDEYDQNALCTSRRYRDCRGLGAFFNPNRCPTGAAGSDVAINDDAGRADVNDNGCARYNHNTGLHHGFTGREQQGDNENHAYDHREAYHARCGGEARPSGDAHDDHDEDDPRGSTCRSSGTDRGRTGSAAVDRQHDGKPRRAEEARAATAKC